MDFPDSAPVLGGVLEDTVAGSVHGCDIQPLVRVGTVQQQRRLHLLQLMLCLRISLQIGLCDRIMPYGIGVFTHLPCPFFLNMYGCKP